MKIRYLFFMFGFVVVTLTIEAQNAKHVWDSIKSVTTPVVAPAFQNQYDMPYRQPLADYGWEDGVQISRSGLQLYALYTPGDLFSWHSFISAYSALPICSLFGNMEYMRSYAQTYTMDFVTSSFGCDSFPNIDILYAERESVADSFVTWQLSGIARGGTIEGSPASLVSDIDTSKLDMFFFTGNNDIWMIKNTTNNPADINNAVRLPNAINPNSNEFNADNPFVERISNDTIILIYEHYTDPSIRTFMYVFSNDLGMTWETPQTITSINNSLGHIEHPCLYKDNSNQWWLYFSIDYVDIVRSKQSIDGNWDSWSIPEVVISKGNAASIGEPSITKNGDISFSLAYKNTVINDSTDVYDLDPWFLPRKEVVGINDNKISDDYVNVSLHPNPFTDFTTFYIDTPFKDATLLVINCFGQTVKQIKNISGQTIIFNRDNLSTGLYFIKLIEDNKVIATKKILITD